MNPETVSRLRVVVGLTGSFLMVASGVAHSFMGWPAVKKALAGADPVTVAGLAVPWHFTGGGMVTFAVLAAWCLVGASHGQPVLLMPVRMIAIAYLLFGICGLILIKPDPTFALFLVPGALLLFASR